MELWNNRPQKNRRSLLNIPIFRRGLVISINQTDIYITALKFYSHPIFVNQRTKLHRLVCFRVFLTTLIHTCCNKIVTKLTTQGCNNIVISWLYQSCWNNLVTNLIVSSSLLQVVRCFFYICSVNLEQAVWAH